MRQALHIGLVVIASLAALGWLHASAPDYLLERGFPLDDAWIHATYVRELARSGTLAYNPGIAAAGETAPLWAIVLSPLYLVAPDASAFVLFVKLFGFLCHVATCVALYLALRRLGVRDWVAVAAAVVVGVHPDMVSASMSGMEIPLATLALAVLLLLVSTRHDAAYAAASACAFLARPEVALFAVLVPLLLGASAPGRRRELARRAVVGAVGAGGAALLVSARNYWVTGRPLPSTFYAKVGTAAESVAWGLGNGFKSVLGMMAVVDNVWLLGGLGLLALVAFVARGADRLPVGSACYVAGLVFFAVSFALVTPIDALAFYHQRYILPGLPLVLAAAPAIVADIAALAKLPGRTQNIVVALICVVILALEIIPASTRYARLANDAHNVDDVQVRMGKYLADAPPEAVLWAVDAGAVRFFGNAFVVDLVGLNTPEMLTPKAQAYLDAHPPAYVDLFAGWTSLDEQSSGSMDLVDFETSTPYTVTRFGEMRAHRLAICDGGKFAGEMTIRNRTFTFTCAAASDANPAPGARPPGPGPR